MTLITHHHIRTRIQEILRQLFSVGLLPDPLGCNQVAVHLIANQNDTTMFLPSTKLL